MGMIGILAAAALIVVGSGVFVAATAWGFVLLFKVLDRISI